MTAILHTVVILALIGCYTVLTALNHDGNQLLLVLGGWVGGAGTAQLAPHVQAALGRRPAGGGG